MKRPGRDHLDRLIEVLQLQKEVIDYEPGALAALQRDQEIEDLIAERESARTQFFVVTHPFIHTAQGLRAIHTEPLPPDSPLRRFPIQHERHAQTVEAWKGHRSGPYLSRDEAERACTAALATGVFFRVEIETVKSQDT